MAGRGRTGDASGVSGTGGLDTRVTNFASSLDAPEDEPSWRIAADPLHRDKPDRVGVGPGLAFARALLRAEGLPLSQAPAEIGLVPCAFGGSPLSRWEDGGDLRAAAVRAVGRALDASPEGSYLAGVLWHQGETDAGADVPESEARGYAARLAECVRSLRDELLTLTPKCARGAGENDETSTRDAPWAPAPAPPAPAAGPLPFVVGTLGEWLDPARFPHAPLVDAGIRALEDRLDGVATVDATGLAHGGDRLHFSAAAANELGRRYAEAWSKVQGRGA
jgi:hypothetical protein